MNPRLALALVVVLTVTVVAIMVFTPKPDSPGLSQAAYDVAKSTVMAESTEPVAPYGTDSASQPDATPVIPPTPALAMDVAPVPTLNAEQIQLRVLELISQFDGAVASGDKALTEELLHELLALRGPALDHLANFAAKHPNEDVREYAAIGLARLGTVEAVGALVTAIHQETNPRVKENLRTILRSVKNPDAIPALIEGIAQRDLTWLHEDAMAIMHSLEEHGAAAALVQAYQEDVELTAAARDRVVEGIASLSDPSSLETLNAVFESDGADQTLQIAAADGLAHIGTPEAVTALLDEAGRTVQPELRNQYLEAVAEVTNKDAVPVLQETLENHTEPDARAAAALALAMDENEPTVERLRQLFEQETSEEVRDAIAASLQQIGARQQ